MYIGILDDDSRFIDILQESLTCYGDNKYEIYNTISNEIFDEQFDIFFLDVMLVDKESFDFGEVLLSKKPSTTLVYISSIDDFVYDSISQTSFFFVRKSNLDSDLIKLFDKYNKKLKKEKEAIEFVSKSCKQVVLQKDIIYIQSTKNSVIIHTQNEDFRVYQSLTITYDQINKENFYKLNSYTIINFNHIKSLDTNQMTLYNNETIRFARDNKKGFIEAYSLYKRRKAWNGF